MTAFDHDRARQNGEAAPWSKSGMDDPLDILIGEDEDDLPDDWEEDTP